MPLIRFRSKHTPPCNLRFPPAAPINLLLQQRRTYGCGCVSPPHVRSIPARGRDCAPSFATRTTHLVDGRPRRVERPCRHARSSYTVSTVILTTVFIPPHGQTNRTTTATPCVCIQHQQEKTAASRRRYMRRERQSAPSRQIAAMTTTAMHHEHLRRLSRSGSWRRRDVLCSIRHIQHVPLVLLRRRRRRVPCCRRRR